MSRRPSRAANAERRATRQARKERAAERTGGKPPSVQAELAPTKLSKRRAVANADPVRERVWTAILVGGAAVAFGLLGRELADAYADRVRPKFQENDLMSAAASLVILAVVGIFSYRRWRLQRDSRQ